MSRTIKFRAIDVKTNNWVFGYYSDNAHIFDANQGVKTKIKKKTLGQFTGLLDKNGVEIYENDIVKGTADYKVGKIEYLNGAFMLLNEPLGLSLWAGDDECGQDAVEIEPSDTKKWATVIGNIYQNPELLPKSKI